MLPTQHVYSEQRKEQEAAGKVAYPPDSEVLFVAYLLHNVLFPYRILLRKISSSRSLPLWGRSTLPTGPTR